MPNITMCQNNECPIKESCYRYKAIPDPRYQSYAIFKYDSDTDECYHFIEENQND